MRMAVILIAVMAGIAGMDIMVATAVTMAVTVTMVATVIMAATVIMVAILVTTIIIQIAVHLQAAATVRKKRRAMTETTGINILAVTATNIKMFCFMSYGIKQNIFLYEIHCYCIGTSNTSTSLVF
jgi:hypothetical protein